MINKKKDLSLIECLIVFAILSMSLFPLIQIIKFASPVNTNTDDEYLASLLAHHVMETIIAKRANNSSFFPSVSESYPVVLASESNKISEYFDDLPEFDGAINKTNSPRLFNAFNKYKCKIDSFFLDSNLFKIVVYISFNKNGHKTRVYFERLLPQNNFEVEDKDIQDNDGVDF